MPTSFIAQDIMAEHLLSHNAIVFLKDKPMRLRSGLVTPIYVDNRILPSYPEAWRDIVETMASRIVELKLDFDVIAGVKAPELLTAPPWLTASAFRSSRCAALPRVTATSAESTVSTSKAKKFSSLRIIFLPVFLYWMQPKYFVKPAPS